MRASQKPISRASSNSAVTAAKAPSSWSGPRLRVNVCSGCRPKRRACGASAESGVAPLTWATHGPRHRARCATSAIARSGTQSSTISGSAAIECEPALGEPSASSPTRRGRRRSPEFARSSAPVPSGYRARSQCSPPSCSDVAALGSRRAGLDRRCPALLRRRRTEARSGRRVDGRAADAPPAAPGPGIRPHRLQGAGRRGARSVRAGRLSRPAWPRSQRPDAARRADARAMGGRCSRILRSALDREAGGHGARLRRDGCGDIRLTASRPPVEARSRQPGGTDRHRAVGRRLRAPRRAGGGRRDPPFP